MTYQSNCLLYYDRHAFLHARTFTHTPRTHAWTYYTCTHTPRTHACPYYTCTHTHTTNIHCTHIHTHTHAHGITYLLIPIPTRIHMQSIPEITANKLLTHSESRDKISVTATISLSSNMSHYIISNTIHVTCNFQLHHHSVHTRKAGDTHRQKPQDSCLIRPPSINRKKAYLQNA